MKSTLISIIKSKTLYAIIFLLGLTIFLYHFLQPDFSNFSVTTPSGETININHPKFLESNQSGQYSLKGTISFNNFDSRLMRFIPDDEILSLNINGQSLDLSIIPYERRKDYNMGFIYDLSNFVQQGENTVEINYSDAGGLMGIAMAAEPSGLNVKLLYISLTLIVLLLSILLARIGKLPLSLKVIFIGAVLIRIFYFSVTPPDVRDHDLGDHFGYNEYLAQHWMPPPLDYAVGGAFFHPPLYYYTGAVINKITKWIEPNNKITLYRTTQLLSLIYSIGFVFFGLLILNSLLNLYKNKWASNPSPSLLWIIGSLFAFWPSAIIHSVRIGNDPLLYCLFLASLYFIIRWYESDAKKDLFIASIVGAAAILTKANGEILVAVLGVIGLYKMIKTREWLRYIKTGAIPAIIMLIAVGITVAPGLLLTLEGKRDKLYIDNIDGLSHANLVGNTASNYFWFDVKTFITEPYTDPYDDRMGRQYFWNYLGKTGLFGEFKYPHLFSVNMAVITSFLFVLMLIYLITGIYRMRKEDFKHCTPILLAGFFLWAGVTYMRMTFPANIDFRYIVPIIITFCGLYAVSILRFESLGFTRWANLGKVLASLFSITSILFIFSIE
jgi:hypothetical protein